MNALSEDKENLTSTKQTEKSCDSVDQKFSSDEHALDSTISIEYLQCIFCKNAS